MQIYRGTHAGATVACGLPLFKPPKRRWRSALGLAWTTLPHRILLHACSAMQSGASTALQCNRILPSSSGFRPTTVLSRAGLRRHSLITAYQARRGAEGQLHTTCACGALGPTLRWRAWRGELHVQIVYLQTCTFLGQPLPFFSLMAQPRSDGWTFFAGFVPFQQSPSLFLSAEISRATRLWKLTFSRLYHGFIENQALASPRTEEPKISHHHQKSSQTFILLFHSAQVPSGPL